MDLGGEAPKIYKIEIAKRKRGECPINKTTKKLFIKTYNNCKDYIVVDNLCFYKMQLVTYSIF